MGKNVYESEAQKEAIKECETRKAERIKSALSPIESFLAPLRVLCLQEKCTFTKKLSGNTGPCEVDYCFEKTQDSDGKYKACKYEYPNGVKTEVNCSDDNLHVLSLGWTCRASDGKIQSATYNCGTYRPTNVSTEPLAYNLDQTEETTIEVANTETNNNDQTAETTKSWWQRLFS